MPTLHDFDTRTGAEARDVALVCLRPGAAKPPLYCVHAQSGHLRLYDNLTAHLSPDRPVYGLRAVPCRESHQRLEDLAGGYAREILELQPCGPYFIVGECDGGELAFELARQLRAAGGDVPLLALLDSFGPGGPRVRASVPTLAYRIVNAMRMLGFHARTVARLGPDRRSHYVQTRLIRATRKLATKALGGRGPYAGEAGRQKAFREALRQYEAKQYPGRVVLFRGAELPWGLEPAPDLGWADVAPQLEMTLLAGYFGTNMLDPHVRALARALERAIEPVASRKS